MKLKKVVSMVVCAALVAMATCAGAADPQGTAASGTPLGNVVDFREAALGPYGRGFLENWRWSNENIDRGKATTRVEVVAIGDRHALRVRIDDGAIFDQGAITLLRLAPYYPPEADAVRMHVKVLSGKVRMFVGGPTAYYANSDVYTRSNEQQAAQPPEWTTIDFELNHPLRRNFRRAGLSTEAQRIYYNRWAQEPVGVFLDAGSQGEFLIERIEIVARGQGRPFPKFAEQDVQLVKSIADFEETPAAPTFTLYMADREVEWFEESWRRAKPLRFSPTMLTVGYNDARRGHVLQAVGPSAEEVHCAGIHTTGAEANAIRLAVHHDAPGYRNTLVGAGPAEAFDVLVFVANANQPRGWQTWAASPELRRQTGPGFDYQLSYSVIRDRQDADFAIYQTRRYLKPCEWITLVLPAADFVCVYGSGAYRDHFQQNRPLECSDVTAVAWLNPWCRAGRSERAPTVGIDDVAFVRVPGEPAKLRSFWQVNSNETIEWRSVPAPRGAERVMLLPGDRW